MTIAYINQIATSVPPYDVHHKFNSYAPTLLPDERQQKLFRRMAQRAQIDHRYSFLEPDETGNGLDRAGFYASDHFPGTAERMVVYKQRAFGLVQQALDALKPDSDSALKDITHIITTTCTGFYAPAIDLQIIKHYGLKQSIERTAIGFMGCHAAINALQTARHIVRSNEKARVLIVNIELCTLHLQKPNNLEELLSFLIFADGCAVSIVSADRTGIAIDSFNMALVPDTQGQITWDVGNDGFDMVLSGAVPQTIAENLPRALPAILNHGSTNDVTHWAVHPGGRTILDAVETGASLPPEALAPSREILRDYGNMSSATVMFVLQKMLSSGSRIDHGCAMAFGPGVAIESMLFNTVNNGQA